MVNILIVLMLYYALEILSHTKDMTNILCHYSEIYSTVFGVMFV